MNGVAQPVDKGSVVNDCASGRLKPGLHAVWSPGFSRHAQPIMTLCIILKQELYRGPFTANNRDTNYEPG